MREKVLVSWSGGKDSALTLFELQHNLSDQYEIVGLLTTITADYDRVTLHGVRRVLLQQQARAIGHPLHIVPIPARLSQAQYSALMQGIMEKYREREVHTVAFGDIFLDHVRTQRESNLAQLNMRALFPLWGRATGSLAQDFIRLGFRAVVTCVDSQELDASFVGKQLDERFLAALPTSVDPCGENGEYHSFVYDGPIFQMPVSHTIAEIVLRENRFYYCDLLPVAST